MIWWEVSSPVYTKDNNIKNKYCYGLKCVQSFWIHSDTFKESVTSNYVLEVANSQVLDYNMLWYLASPVYEYMIVFSVHVTVHKHQYMQAQLWNIVVSIQRTQGKHIENRYPDST